VAALRPLMSLLRNGEFATSINPSNYMALICCTNRNSLAHPLLLPKHSCILLQPWTRTSPTHGYLVLRVMHHSLHLLHTQTLSLNTSILLPLCLSFLLGHKHTSTHRDSPPLHMSHDRIHMQSCKTCSGQCVHQPIDVRCAMLGSVEAAV
jgi:hypothetical protein